MRILGIDLAVTARHRAILADERGRFISRLLKFRTCEADLDRVYATARKGMAPDEPLIVVLEATDIVWHPPTVYFLRRGATVYVVNPRMAADLARFYKRHAKSDRLSAKVLARLPVVSPDSLYPYVPPGADHLALQRGCKELERLTTAASAIKNRLQSMDHLGWPDLKRRVFPDPLSPAARWFRDHVYDPHQVLEAGTSGLCQAWQRADGLYDGDEDWIEPLVTLAKEMLTLYGTQGDYLDYAALAAEVRREQRRLADLEAEERFVRLKVTRPLYRRLHPSRNLETLYGVGQDGAAVYTAFIHHAERFPNNRAFRGWHGLVPRSSQSGECESKGLRISQAGPDPIKKYGFLGAETARQWDPQIAAIYHDQMMNKGNHHTQAVCACATHLLDRVRVILLEDRPYELRDVDGTPVTHQQARAIIAERYTVPDEVRQRNNHRARRERARRRAERKEERESRSR
jgi:transposase